MGHMVGPSGEKEGITPKALPDRQAGCICARRRVLEAVRWNRGTCGARRRIGGCMGCARVSSTFRLITYPTVSSGAIHVHLPWLKRGVGKGAEAGDGCFGASGACGLWVRVKGVSGGLSIVTIVRGRNVN